MIAENTNIVNYLQFDGVRVSDIDDADKLSNLPCTPRYTRDYNSQYCRSNYANRRPHSSQVYEESSAIFIDNRCWIQNTNIHVSRDVYSKPVFGKYIGPLLADTHSLFRRGRFSSSQVSPGATARIGVGAAAGIILLAMVGDFFFLKNRAARLEGLVEVKTTEDTLD